MDAKYEKADLNAVVTENCKHLSSSDQKKLLKLLAEFEVLFNGILGDWDTEGRAQSNIMAGLFGLQKSIKKLRKRNFRDFVT